MPPPALLAFLLVALRSIALAAYAQVGGIPYGLEASRTLSIFSKWEAPLSKREKDTWSTFDVRGIRVY
jgi:hypothetical protein